MPCSTSWNRSSRAVSTGTSTRRPSGSRTSSSRTRRAATTWEPADSRLTDVAQNRVGSEPADRGQLPYYHLSIWTAFGRHEAWAEWVRRWTAEEGKHAIVLRDFLTLTRGVDPVQLERGRRTMVSKGWYPEFAELGQLDGVVFTSIQELATRLSHRNTGLITDDVRAVKLTSRIATDENLHYVFYRDLAAAAFEIDPSAAMLALRRQIIGSRCPVWGWWGSPTRLARWRGSASTNSGIHLEQVLKPILLTRWKITEITGLSEEAASARDDVIAHLARMEPVAGKLGEPSAPALARSTEG
jgi:acyl-[acyl-carrier-protein] desaturase